MQVAYNVADNVPKLVTCDAQRLQQVLLNVLNNAVKFTEKGEVLLEVWCEAQEDGCLNQSAKQAQQDVPADPFDSQDQADGSEAFEQQPEPLLGHVSKDSGQRITLNSPALEAFRPLTPDNLSQHTELAEMRQQKQGPAPSFADDATGNIAALAASFNVCEGGGKCSCPPGQEDSKLSCSKLASAGLRQQTASTDPQAEEDHDSASPGSPKQEHQQQQDSKSQPASSDISTTAPAARSTAGQQHILATSTASAEAGSSVEGRTPRADAASDAIAAEAAHQLGESRRRQAMDCSQEQMQLRRNGSQASTSGRSVEDAAQYTINFSVRDSGIGISSENLTNLFQCFCQVCSASQRTMMGPKPLHTPKPLHLFLGRDCSMNTFLAPHLSWSTSSVIFACRIRPTFATAFVTADEVATA